MKNKRKNDDVYIDSVFFKPNYEFFNFKTYEDYEKDPIGSKLLNKKVIYAGNLTYEDDAGVSFFLKATKYAEETMIDELDNILNENREKLIKADHDAAELFFGGYDKTENRALWEWTGISEMWGVLLLEFNSLKALGEYDDVYGWDNFSKDYPKFIKALEKFVFEPLSKCFNDKVGMYLLGHNLVGEFSDGLEEETYHYKEYDFPYESNFVRAFYRISYENDRQDKEKN